MATINKTKNEPIFIQIDNERIELTGVELEAFEADRKATAETNALLEAEYEAKKQKRIDAINKLAEVAGLTEEEINAILNI